MDDAFLTPGDDYKKKYNTPLLGKIFLLCICLQTLVLVSITGIFFVQGLNSSIRYHCTLELIFCLSLLFLRFKRYCMKTNMSSIMFKYLP
eukprot:UN25393